MSQKEKQYSEFQEELEEIPRGIPMGQPRTNVQQQYPGSNFYPVNPYQQPMGQQMQPQQPYFNQGMPMMQPQQPQGYSRKMLNSSMQLQCPCCKNQVQSVVNCESGNTAVIWSVAIFCVVGQCCCLPFLFDDCLDKAHYCPNCGYQIMRKHAKCFEIINA